MSEELNALVTMAEQDKKILELRRHLRQIPKKIAEARKQLDAEQLLLDEVKIPWETLDREITEKSTTIQIALDTITKFEEHMTKVTTQKEYMMARKQIDEARRLNTRLQDEIIEGREKKEELDPALTEVQSRYDKVKESFDSVEGGILGEKAELDRQIAELEATKTEAAKSVDARTLGYYKRISNAGLIPALAEVVAGVCGGCSIALPPQAYNQLIANPTNYQLCEHCNRMLYFVPVPESEGDEAAEPPQAKVS